MITSDPQRKLRPGLAEFAVNRFRAKRLPFFSSVRSVMTRTPTAFGPVPPPLDQAVAVQ